MTDFIFTSVAFGPRYVEQQIRLHASICEHYSADHHIQWTDTLPPGSKPHAESLYGFKVHAVNYAREKGYKKIIWIDTACVLQKKVDHWFKILPKYGVIAAKDDNKLKNHIAQKALFWYSKFTIPDSYHLIGGSLYVFDFDIPLCQKIFITWEAAEAHGVFGSQKEQASGKIDKHRHDESCLAMSLYMHDSKPTPYDIAKYNNGPDSIVIKDHFK